MNAALQVFTFQPEHKIRVTLDTDGGLWWIAADVCAALGIKNNRQALARLDDDEKGVSQTDTLGGSQKMATINESGLYGLILRSDKPTARPFRKWVTSVVLPQIRKTGRFAVAKSPGRALVETEDTISMSEVGRLTKLGRNRLMERLRKEKILDGKNQPYQQFIDRGYFVVVEREWRTPDGESHVQLVTRATQKGLEWMMVKFAAMEPVWLPAPKGHEADYTEE